MSFQALLLLQKLRAVCRELAKKGKLTEGRGCSEMEKGSQGICYTP